MSYDYQKERAYIFTEAGVVRLLKIRERIQSLLKTAGAFRIAESGLSDWSDLACIDYLVEIGELVEFKRECWAQFRVFTTPNTDGR